MAQRWRDRRASLAARPGDRPGAGPGQGTHCQHGGCPTAPSTRPAWRSFRHSVQTAAANATDDAPRGPGPSTGSARGQQVTDLRAGDGAPAGPSTRTARQPRGPSGAGAGRARHDGQGDQASQIVVAVPGRRARAPGRPPRPGRARRVAPSRWCRQDLLGGVHRVAGAAPVDLEPARLGARDLGGEGLGQGVAVLGGRDGPLPRLLPGVVGHDEEEPVEPELLDHGPRRGDVPDVRRVEGAPEDPDAGRGLRCRQVRRSPAPARPSRPRARRCS